MTQQGDVLLTQTPNDGDIEAANGTITMTAGFETAVYLSMFAGAEWWGDLEETDPDFRYPSETEQVLESVAAVPANLRRVEQAALRDLAWAKSTGVANVLEVTATMPGVDQVKIVVNIEARGKRAQFTFVENWQAVAAADAFFAPTVPVVADLSTLNPVVPIVPVGPIVTKAISVIGSESLPFGVEVIGFNGPLAFGSLGDPFLEGYTVNVLQITYNTGDEVGGPSSAQITLNNGLLTADFMTSLELEGVGVFDVLQSFTSNAGEASWAFSPSVDNLGIGDWVDGLARNVDVTLAVPVADGIPTLNSRQTAFDDFLTAGSQQIEFLGTGSGRSIITISFYNGVAGTQMGVALNGLGGFLITAQGVTGGQSKAMIIHHWDRTRSPGAGPATLSYTSELPGQIQMTMVILELTYSEQDELVIRDTWSFLDYPAMVTGTVMSIPVLGQEGKLGIVAFGADATAPTTMALAPSGNLGSDTFVSDGALLSLATWEDGGVDSNTEIYDVAYTKTGGGDILGAIYGSFFVDAYVPLREWEEVGNFPVRFIRKIAVNSVTGDRWVAAENNGVIYLAAGTSTVWIDQGWNPANTVNGLEVYPANGDVYAAAGNLFTRFGGVGPWVATPGTGYTGGGHERLALDVTTGDLYSFANISQELWKRDGGTDSWYLISTPGGLGINFSGLAFNPADGVLWGSADGNNTIYRNLAGGVGGLAAWEDITGYPSTGPNDIAVDSTSGDVYVPDRTNPGKVYVLRGGTLPFEDTGWTAPFASGVGFDESKGVAWVGSYELAAPGSMYSYDFPP